MEQGQCPHCGVASEAADATFCASCGMAVSHDGAASGPRIIESGELATSGTGRELQSEALQKQAKKAASALLAVAILQWLFGAIILAWAKYLAPPEVQPDVVVLAAVFGIGVIFFGFYLWARRNPLPAAITGLVFFITLHALEAVVDPTALIRGILVKIIVIVVLSRAIAAGVRYRRLRLQMEIG